MKKLYEKPELEINFIEVEDITTSSLKIESNQSTFESISDYSSLF